MTVSRQQFDRAYEDGCAARRAGRPASACPHYGNGDDAEVLAERWHEGHQRADDERKGRV